MLQLKNSNFISICIIIIFLIDQCFTQDPDRYWNDVPQGQCSYTFQVPAEQVNSQCMSPELRQYLDEIRTENQQISAENGQLRTEIQTIIREYGEMIATVKKLEQETSSWREIVEWPVYDVPFSSDEIGEIINNGTKYTDCFQAIKRNKGKKGIYTVNPKDAPHPHFLYCDSQGWTVVFRRFDGKVDFHRNWNDFSGGFGELAGEHFVGLELLHTLTSNKPYEFRVEMIGWNNKLYTSVYDNFVVSDEIDGYALSIGNMSSGNLESSFAVLNGTKFTTLDRDNDDWYQNNCAIHYRGGWWLQNCGSDPSRAWCNGTGCMSWGDHTAKKIILKIRPMAVKGSIVPTAKPKPEPKPKPVKPKRNKPKKPRNKRISKSKETQ